MTTWFKISQMVLITQGGKSVSPNTNPELGYVSDVEETSHNHLQDAFH